MVKRLFEHTFDTKREGIHFCSSGTITGVSMNFKYGKDAGLDKPKEFPEALKLLCLEKSLLNSLEDLFRDFGEECFILYCRAIVEQMVMIEEKGVCDYSIFQGGTKSAEDVRNLCKHYYENDKAKMEK
jgi:hypothetical protein